MGRLDPGIADGRLSFMTRTLELSDLRNANEKALAHSPAPRLR
jgi:hypothetical protein